MRLEWKKQNQGWVLQVITIRAQKRFTFDYICLHFRRRKRDLIVTTLTYPTKIGKPSAVVCHFSILFCWQKFLGKSMDDHPLIYLVYLGFRGRTKNNRCSRRAKQPRQVGLIFFFFFFKKTILIDFREFIKNKKNSISVARVSFVLMIVGSNFDKLMCLQGKTG